MELQIVGTNNDAKTKKLLCTAAAVQVPVKLSTNSKLFLNESKTDTSSFGALITYDGNVLPTSVALCYLARLRPDLCLYGRTFEEMALVDKAMRDTEKSFIIPLEVCKSSQDPKTKAPKNIIDNIDHALETIINPILLISTFLVGERLTIADIDLAITLNEAITNQYIKSIEKYPSVSRWYNLIMQQPVFQKILGKSKGEPTQKKAPVKEQQKEKPKDKEVDIEEDAPKPKKKSALESLPPSSFILDQWKRLYSNSKDLKEAMKWFWDNFDAEGWSLWYVRYDKLEGENTKGYTTANMLGGFMQRIDPAFRQYSFGVMNVVEAKDVFEIQGVWLVRGQNIPEELEAHPSYEFYIFKKLDPTKTESKQLTEEYWCNDDMVEGLRIESCTVWK